MPLTLANRDGEKLAYSRPHVLASSTRVTRSRNSATGATAPGGRPARNHGHALPANPVDAFHPRVSGPLPLARNHTLALAADPLDLFHPRVNGPPCALPLSPRSSRPCSHPMDYSDEDDAPWTEHRVRIAINEILDGFVDNLEPDGDVQEQRADAFR